MSKIKTRILMLASAAVVALPVAIAIAAPTSVPVTVSFRQAITLNTTSDLAFGQIDYASAAVTGADTVTIDPDGTATPAGTFTLGAGPRTSGNVNVVTADALAASVYCDTSATLTSGANSIVVNNVTIDANAGADIACSGIGTGVGSFVLTGGGADNIRVGGTLDGATALPGGNIVSGAYAGSINLDVIYD